MLKLNILNLKKFLATINSCENEVYIISSDGTKININKQYAAQNNLWEEYNKNKNYLHLTLKVSNPKDYMSIVSYYAGDC